MKWLLFALLFPALSFAQFTTPGECTSVDLRTDNLKQIRNQRGISWCYAFTAADLLTEVYGLPEKASAADIAIHYNDSDVGLLMQLLRGIFGKQPTPTESEAFMMPAQTGFIKIALEHAMRDGYCPERVFSSESWTRMGRSEKSWKSTTVEPKSAMLEIYRLIKTQDTLTTANLPYWFKFKNIATPEDFLGLIQGSTLESFYPKLRERVCRNDRRPFPKAYPALMFFNDLSLFSVINQQLSRGRLVSIDYDSRVLKDRMSVGISLDELHTSTIVGRRWNSSTGQCQYLIRDSKGAGCEIYDRSYECLGGQVWLDEFVLLPNLVSAVYLQSPKRSR